MKRIYLFAAVLMAPLLVAPASAETTIEGAWVRMPPPVVDTAAGYLVLNNSGGQEVSVVAIVCDAATAPEFHSMQTHDGMVHMQKMEVVSIPAGGSVRFEPGGDHLMLKGLTRELKAGDHVAIKIGLSNGESVSVAAEVLDMRAKPQGEGHGSGHHHH